MRAVRPSSIGDASTVLSIFAQGLFHRLRTPLSVISNELTYLARQAGEENCALAVKHCAEISRILREIDSTLRHKPGMKSTSLEELLSSVGVRSSSKTARAAVNCDLEAFATAFRAVTEKLFSQSPLQAIVGSEGGQIVLTLVYQEAGLQENGSPGTYASLSEIACRLFDRGLLEASLCDVTLGVQEIHFEAVLSHDELRLNFHFDSAGKTK